jgi:hypothetical protein
VDLRDGSGEVDRWLHFLQWAGWGRWAVWDTSVCASAASAGRLEVLVWLREYDCPWDMMTTAWARVDGNEMVVDWARKKGCGRV